MKGRKRRLAVVYPLLTLTTIVLAAPVAWFVLLSLRSNEVIKGGLESITSTEFTLENYVSLFTQYNVGLYMVNSLIGTVIPAVLSVVLGLFAGYALRRFEFPGRGFFYSLPLFAQVVPLIQLVVPLYVIMVAVNLVNTYAAIIIAHLCLVLPLSIWMMTGYMSSIPKEIEEAAMLDGCSRVGTVFRVVIPVALPGIAATGLYAFLETWGEFLVAYLLTSTEDMRLLAVAVYTLVPGSLSPTSWGVLFAASAVFALPALVIFLVLQRSFQQGLTLGSVAGH
jgi:multiple sugar transport system permease protein